MTRHLNGPDRQAGDLDEAVEDTGRDPEVAGQKLVPEDGPVIGRHVQQPTAGTALCPIARSTWRNSRGWHYTWSRPARLARLLPSKSDDSRRAATVISIE